MTVQRLRYNFLTGTIQSISPTNIITFTNATGLGNITITNGTNYLPLIINLLHMDLLPIQKLYG